MMRNDLIALAERCEAATGLNRELNCDIAMATGVSPLFRDPAALGFTGSLDAAMSLVPEGVRVYLNTAEDGITTALVDGTQGCADGPALALCAAALRARAAQEATQ